MLPTRQFERIRRLALSLASIELVERHCELLDRRSRRLGILDPAGLDPLLDRAEKGETDAIQQLLGLLTTKFTGFFRNPRHFEIAAEHALRAARQRSVARLWSAGAATGEEPYSLAMAVVEVFDQDDPPATILATDLDEQALVAARNGQFRDQALAGLTPERQKRFLLKGSMHGCHVIAPNARRRVEFRMINLAKADWPIEGDFDVILCRNVLMYLENNCRCVALQRMAALLAPDGLLIQDPSEHLGAAANLFTSRGDGVYVVRPSWESDGRGRGRLPMRMAL
jgi:chemotaxis protein methyltransferase CheR